jgi:HD-GYP domain-containing protein (c-di-GMP phosphodiesterase class II)
VLLGSADELSALDVATVDSGGPVALQVLPCAPAFLQNTLRCQAQASRARQSQAELELALAQASYENTLLIDIGRALSQQRDIDSLLQIILGRAREVTGADAGSIYVVEGDQEDVRQRVLRFRVAQNDSRAIATRGFTMPVSPSSIVGACVISRQVIDIPDLYQLDPPGQGNNPWGFVHDRSFDTRHRYQTRSMLTVPMISARDQVIGVIQLINKRARGVSALDDDAAFARGVIPFDPVSAAYAATLASQAGIALENALLHDEVKTLFEGFVRASVMAIEARDPTTSGHSERVARLTLGLAQAVDRVDDGPFATLRLSSDDLKQIEYAALLHDFGKVGVREHVLVKPRKLYEHERELLEARFAFIRKSLEAEMLASKVRYLIEASREPLVVQLAELDAELAQRLAEVDDFLAFVLQANEPTVLDQGGFERIADIAARRFLDPAGREQPYLSERETRALQIRRGSLTSEERSEIESHVVHTYNFLRKIPWGRSYRGVPEIAGAHHEKVDGTGYPAGLRGEQIPLPARMMTIADIYDALTAADRPYKKAVPEQRALDILRSDVAAGKLDAALFQVFIEAGIFQLVRS